MDAVQVGIIAVGGLLLLGMFVVLPFMERHALPGSITRRAQKSGEATRARWMAAPVTELVDTARDRVRFAGWTDLPEARELLQGDDWTEARLAGVLDRLWAALRADDDTRGRSGRSSNAFEYHDCGLALVHEVARARAAEG